ncbi:MAG: shikimate dehydrogenase family protein [Bacteroidota bacterium]
MRRYGLIGYPLEHSFSKDYFTAKFKREKIDAVYENFSIKSVDEMPSLVKKYPDLKGLNVTLPYKTEVMKYLDLIDEKALRVGAVNVINISIKAGKRILEGYNTDVDGFVLSLKPLIGRGITRALVLGTGGASRAVQAGLDDLGIKYSLVSRDKEKTGLTYRDLSDEMISSCQLLVNATPLGMFPNTESAPDIPYSSLKKDCILFDLVYNPDRSRFLKLGQERGCRIKNGREMLHIQAEKAWEIWER